MIIIDPKFIVVESKLNYEQVKPYIESFRKSGKKYDDIIEFLIGEYNRLKDFKGFNDEKYCTAINYYKLMNEGHFEDAKNLKCQYYCKNSGGFPKLPNRLNFNVI